MVWFRIEAQQYYKKSPLNRGFPIAFAEEEDSLRASQTSHTANATCNPLGIGT